MLDFLRERTISVSPMWQVSLLLAIKTSSVLLKGIPTSTEHFGFVSIPIKSLYTENQKSLCVVEVENLCIILQYKSTSGNVVL